MDRVSAFEYAVLMTSSAGTRRSVLIPSRFAEQLAAHLWHLVESQGGDRSGRWLEKRTEARKTYWAKILNGTQAMTSNDIAAVAAVFDISPYDFVRDARRIDDTENVTSLPVRGRRDDEALPRAAHPAELEPTDEQP